MPVHFLLDMAIFKKSDAPVGSPHEVCEHAIGGASASAQLAAILWLHLDIN